MNPKQQPDGSSPPGVKPSRANSEIELNAIKYSECRTCKHLSSPNAPTKANTEAGSMSKSSSPSITLQTSNDNDASTESRRGSGNILQNPPARRPQSPSWTSNLWGKLKQHATLLLFTIFALFVLACSTWLVFIEFISRQEVPFHLQLSPGKTITIVNILSHVNMLLVMNIFEPALDVFRKFIATRDQGALSTTFLAMCATVAITDTGPLFRLKGWHQLLYVSRQVLQSSLTLF
jgi:hypothetical protein